MNFKQLSFQQKNKLLFIGIGLFAIIVYLFAIKITIVLYGEYTELKQQMAVANNAPQQIQKYQNQMANIQNILGKQNTDYSHEALLAGITGFCQKHRLTLRDFPKPHLQEESDFSIYTNLLDVEGNFFDMLQLAYELEYQKKSGHIASVEFGWEKDRQTKRKFLNMIIYLQNLQSHEKN